MLRSLNLHKIDPFNSSFIYKDYMLILYTFYTDYLQILTTIKNKIKSKSIFIKVFKTYFLILSVSYYTKYHNINSMMITTSMIT